MVERYSDGSSFEALASYCRATRSGPLVSVSGTAATDDEGNALCPDDTYGQTMEALRRALAGAQQLGAGREEVVRTRLFLIPESDWKGAVRAHGEVFDGAAPANTTLYVAGFIPSGVLVEVELDAWVAQ